MAYEKKLVVLYSYYAMVSSYFRSYKVTNDIPEKRLYLHYREANNDFQISCEDFCIYSIEKVLPKLISVDLEKYDAKIILKPEESKLVIVTKDFKFDVFADYDKGKPSIRYENIQLREK